MATPTPRGRGRPSTGQRKEVIGVPMAPDDAEILEAGAAALGRAKADVARALIKDEMAWADVVKAARKGRR